jgi:exosortase A-associated hydrolase 2
VARRPASPPRGCVLIAPPFGEEMNKSRRMLSEVSHALAGRGLATVLPDLYGTGDSGGDFSDATWATWLDDLARTARWCHESIHTVTSILAVRLGCALASEAAVSGGIGPVAKTVLWQPVFDGRKFLTQFFRLRIAAALVEQDKKESLEDLLAQSARGEVVEVAGYGVAPALVSELNAVAQPPSLPQELGRMVWMDVVREAGAIPAAGQKLIERTRAAGGAIEHRAIVAEPFWAATEITTSAQVLTATTEALANEL